MCSLTKALLVLTLGLCLNFGAEGQYGGGSSQESPYTYGNLHAQYVKNGVDASPAMLGEDLLGDSIDPLTGRLSVSHTDISLPGNFALPVSLSRSTGKVERHFAAAASLMADWTPNFAFVRARIPDTQSWRADRCTGAPHNVGQGNGVPLWQGMQIFTPNEGMRPVLNFRSGNWGASGVKYVTKDYWRISCISSIPAGGQGFKATSPQGVSYHFTALKTGRDRKFPPSRYTRDSDIWAKHVLLYATKIEDVNGNWVQFDYSDTSKAGPTRIYSNDGRDIRLTYSSNGQLITSATANGRTWRYTYASGNFGTTLTRVTLPDGRHWNFTSLDWLTIVHDDPSNDAHCMFMQYDHVPSSIKHPDGTVGTYNAKFQVIDLGVGRPNPTGYGSGTPVYIGHLNPCEGNLAKATWGQPLGIFAGIMPSRSISRRQLTVPGGANYVWTYDYEDRRSEGHKATEGYLYIPAPLVRRSKTDPNGVRTDTYLINEWGWGHGAPYKIQTFATASSNTPIETQYIVQGPYLWMVGDAMYTGNIHSSKMGLSTVVEKRITVRGSDVYTTEYEYNHDINSSTWSKENPTKITRFSTLQPGSRTTQTSYQHLRSSWILARPKSVQHNAKLIDSTTYDARGRPTALKKFGATYATLAYNNDGTVSSVRDALNRTISLSNYKRGQAQSTTLPDGNKVSRTVDNNGWVTREVNARGHATVYQYNNMGWLIRIDRPGSWADTTLSYSNLGNGLKQTVTRGNSRTVTTYDGFLRPTIVQAIDLTGHSRTRYTRTSYDALGRVDFVSFPTFAAYPTRGVLTSYDALGRVTQTRENVAPYATTRTEYLSGNRVRVTDPVGAQTLTTYRAFGAPSLTEPIQVVDATGTTTTLTRDIWGNITNLNQKSGLNGYTVNVNRKFWYDSRFRLCRHSAPEFGHELFAYDAANQLTLASRGEPAGSGCATPTAARRTAFSYDAMGRQTLVNFPSGTPDISRSYDANGNEVRNTRGGIIWDYAYTELDQISQEKLRIDGRVFAFDYGRNANGYVTSRSSPSGLLFEFTPDGFGQPTRLRESGVSYLWGVGYHANGLVHTGGYGNLQLLGQSLTERGQPLRVRTRKSGGSVALDLQYAYDARGKVISETNHTLPDYHRTFSYDGSGRLLTANSKWGAGRFKYDGLGNLREKQLGNRFVRINYNSKNQIATVTDTDNPFRRFTHDVRGNVTHDGRFGFTYDYSNQPVSIDIGSSDLPNAYDGNLKRAKNRFTNRSGALETVYTAYSRVSGTPIYRYYSSGNEFDYPEDIGPLSVWFYNGAWHSYRHLDPLGSVRAETRRDGDRVSWHEEYTPFGERLLGVTNFNNPGFTGHVRDMDTGLNYMQARYYDPVIGRFLSTDPIGYQDQLNLYAYVHNDPVNATDPTGEFAVTLGVDIDVSVAGFGLGVQFKVGGSVTGNFKDGFRVQSGGTGSVSTGVSNTTLKDSNASLLDKAGSIAVGLFTDTGASATGEVGAFTGTSANPADLSDLGGTSAELGVSIDKKGLANKLPGVAGAFAKRAPGAQLSGQLIAGENGIKGIELGGGVAGGNPVIGSGGSTTADVNKTDVVILTDTERN